MAKKKPAPKSAITLTGKCEMFVSVEMRCPLCRILVPAGTAHKCKVGR